MRFHYQPGDEDEDAAGADACGEHEISRRLVEHRDMTRARRRV